MFKRRCVLSSAGGTSSEGGRRLRRARALLAGAAAAVLGTGLAGGLPGADARGVSPSITPASWTPHLLERPGGQVVRELRACRGTMFAVGTIRAVGWGSQTYRRSNAFSFSATTGEPTAWAPSVNGQVRSIALSADCRTAYLGGSFSAVNGVVAHNLVAVDAVTGRVRKRFRHDVNGRVHTVRHVRHAVIVGGAFSVVNGVRRTELASLTPRTGKVTSYLNLRFAGAYRKAPPKVYNSQISHDRRRLLIEGVFTSINGNPRRQVAVLTLGRSRVRLDRWRSKELLRSCRIRFYVKAGAWSPDDRTIYLASTGYAPVSGPGSTHTEPRTGLCDAAMAFPAAHAPVQHEWVNYTGCDSLYAVAADDSEVFIGGHERWADNGNGCDAAGPGALSRPGIGSLSPFTGLATAWNPTRSRGHGVNQLLITAAGVWVASDTGKDGASQQCGGLPAHGGICFLPFQAP